MYTSKWTLKAILSALTLMLSSAAVLADSEPYTIAKYPVEAAADNAAEAQEQALADGRRAALQALFKRLLPVTAYRHLPKLRDVDPVRLISRVSVRSAQNSSTEYIAALDFSFDAKGVRDILRARGIPFVDEQARDTVVIPLLIAADPTAKDGIKLMSAGGQMQAWSVVWRDLDLDNALAPVKIAAVKPGIDAATVKAAKAFDPSFLSTLATRYQVPQVLLAIGEIDSNTRRFKVTLAGQDAVGPFTLNRSYPFRPGEASYAMEMAAVVAIGSLEGRWKAVQVTTPGAGARDDGPPVPVQLIVEFQSMAQWRQLRQQIASAPGVEDVQIGGMSSNGADMALRYPGGGPSLKAALAPRGITLQEIGGTWVARPGY